MSILRYIVVYSNGLLVAEQDSWDRALFAPKVLEYCRQSGKRLGESYVWIWKTKGDAVPFITDLYSLDGSIEKG